MKVANACRGHTECAFALYNVAPTYSGLRDSLRSAITVSDIAQASQFTQSTEREEQYWTERRYNGRGSSHRQSRPPRTPASKKCFICDKTECWSTKHTPEERRKAYERFSTSRYTRDRSQTAYAQFLTWYEGGDDTQDTKEDGIRQFFQDNDAESDEQENNNHEEQLYTNFFVEPSDACKVATLLADESTRHALTKEDPSRHGEQDHTHTYLAESRYSAASFQGIMPDTGAAEFSTGGHPQFRALQRIMPEVQLDTSTAGMASIRFGQGDPILSLGTTTVPTPIGPIDFQVMPTSTPFLLSIKDMDTMGVVFDNLANVITRNNVKVPIVRKWGHPWLQLDRETVLAGNYLTDGELRRLHRRFGHPSVARLHKVLNVAGHPVEHAALEFLNKVCHQCQMNAGRPQRFRINLRDDLEFNYEITVDVFHLEKGRPALHVVDTATAFNAGRLLSNMSSRHMWECLRLCWIDVYQGPPDVITTDAGTSFTSDEFKQLAKDMAIAVKEVPVEAHNSIGKVERYHGPLRRAYRIIRAEDPSISPEAALQMAIKAVNDTAGPDGIVPTLLVFGAYPRMTDESPPSPSVRLRAIAYRKAVEEVRRAHAERQVKEGLAMRNGPNTAYTINLTVNSLVRVYREKKGWTGPFRLIAIEGENCTVQGSHGSHTFRSTQVKPYYQDPAAHKPNNPIPGEPGQSENPVTSQEVEDRPRSETQDPEGEPIEDTIIVGGAASNAYVQSMARVFLQETDVPETYITEKEKADAVLAVQLRAEGKITTPGKPFEESAQQEIDSLIARGVFEFVPFNKREHGDTRIFKARIVNEVKGKTTDKPYEKSRLVVQGYGDEGKEAILTQSPTIQRASQRLILCLIPTLIQEGNVAWLRDITQAYVQSDTTLNRTILTYLPSQIRHIHPDNTVMRIIKPLYGLAEAGTHWWATYHNHHLKKLQMTTSTYDPCLLITTPENPDFAVVGMQTDDTLGLSTVEFSQREDDQLQKAAFNAKPKQVLTEQEPLVFNGGILTLTQGTVILRQKGQAKRLELVNPTAPDAKQRYVEQRARGAYIASICQPEACFDLSSAAQHQEPNPEDIKALNKRIQWQIDHQDRGLSFVPLDLGTAKLFVFVDGAFANNRDLTSQLGFVIVLGNETPLENGNKFILTGNIVHFSSTKSKRITRSVLASEVYGMVAGVDMAYALATTLRMITAKLSLPTVPTVICTDSYSLYECLVKLGTTKEKRLMIDIMALRQSYERRELHEVRWIHGEDNLSDAFTKATPNSALAQFIEGNRAAIRVEGWVSR